MAPMTLDIDRIEAPPQQAPVCSGHWLHVMSHIDPRYGGLSAAVPQLASAVAAYSGGKASLAGFCGPEERDPELTATQLAVSRWPAGRLTWFHNRALHDRFQQQLEQVDGVHVHGLWEQSTYVSATASRQSRTPYVLSAHGMLDSWALDNKRLKKAMYAALSERGNVRRAACLHALTHTEAEDYRRFGAIQPIAIIPNGVNVPPNTDGELFLTRFPALRAKRIVLFLSRLHFKKGLDILAQAWSRIAKRHPDAHLVLAGPDFGGTRARIEALLAAENISDRVTFTGMLEQQAKWSALRASECFVLPSYSEGLSVAALEALGSGLPVIITEQCNLPEVAESEAGWTIQPDASQLCSALDEMLSHSTETNRRIGENGRALVNRKYSWPLIGQKMSEVYAWILGGELPSTVELIRN